MEKNFSDTFEQMTTLQTIFPCTHKYLKYLKDPTYVARSVYYNPSFFTRLSLVTAIVQESKEKSKTKE